MALFNALTPPTACRHASGTINHDKTCHQDPGRLPQAGRQALFLMALLLFGLIGSVAFAQTAPDFTLKSASGENIKLSELRGEVVLINFWASWCAPCRQEMPHLDALHKRYAPLGFTVLGVNVEEDPAPARHFLKDSPVAFPVLFDARNQVSKLYDVSAMPSTVLVDRDGNVRHLHKGYQPGLETTYQQQVSELVRE